MDKKKKNIVLAIIVFLLVVVLIYIPTEDFKKRIAPSKEYCFREFNILREKFDNMDSRAQRTGRFDLSPVIGEMQEVKTELEYLPLLGICKHYSSEYASEREKALEYMESRIQESLDFLAE